MKVAPNPADGSCAIDGGSRPSCYITTITLWNLLHSTTTTEVSRTSEGSLSQITNPWLCIVFWKPISLRGSNTILYLYSQRIIFGINCQRTKTINLFLNHDEGVMITFTSVPSYSNSLVRRMARETWGNHLWLWGVGMWWWKSCFCNILTGLWPTKGMGCRYTHLVRNIPCQAWVGPCPGPHTAFLSRSYQACVWKPHGGEMYGRTWEPMPALDSSDLNLKWHNCYLLVVPPHNLWLTTFLVFTHLKPFNHVLPGASFLPVVIPSSFCGSSW